MAAGTDLVLYTLDNDGVAFLTLNRPERLNAANGPLLEQLVARLEDCAADPTVRVVHLTGAGRAFCAGFDLYQVAPDADDATLAAVFGRQLTLWNLATAGLVRLGKPVVAAVNGVAVGGGLGLALAADFTVAAASARFLMAYHGIGLTPDSTTTYHLPRYIGLKRALEWACTNRTLQADEAAAWGVVNTVVPDADLRGYSTELARGLARTAAPLVARTKGLFHGAWTESLETQAELEKQGVLWAVQQPAFRAALAAFHDKQRPATRAPADVPPSGPA